MRLAAFLGVLLTLLLLGGAAYLPGRWWQLALYAATVLGTIAGMAVLSAVGETLAEPRGPMVRALLALAAGGFAAWVARRGRPGAVDELPFHDLRATAISVVGLGAMLVALGFSASVLRGPRRGPNLLAGLALLLGLYALWPWVRR